MKTEKISSTIIEYARTPYSIYKDKDLVVDAKFVCHKFGYYWVTNQYLAEQYSSINLEKAIQKTIPANYKQHNIYYQLIKDYNFLTNISKLKVNNTFKGGY